MTFTMLCLNRLGQRLGFNWLPPPRNPPLPRPAQNTFVQVEPVVAALQSMPP